MSCRCEHTAEHTAENTAEHTAERTSCQISTMDSHYIYFSSNDSVHFYPKNTLADFKVELEPALDLSGTWEIALLDCNYNKETHSNGNTFIYLACDLCVESRIHNNSQPILIRLERIMTKKEPRYVRVRAGRNTMRIHMRMLDTNVEPLCVDHLKGQFMGILHLRRIEKNI